MNREETAAADRLAAMAATAALEIASVTAILNLAQNTGERDDLASANLCAEIVLSLISERLSTIETALHRADLGAAA